MNVLLAELHNNVPRPIVCQIGEPLVTVNVRLTFDRTNGSRHVCQDCITMLAKRSSFCWLDADCRIVDDAFLGYFRFSDITR